MKFEVMVITPKIAEEMLNKNSRNRKIDQNVVALYAQDMLDGNWDLTPVPIIFDKDGNLSDGQHRLRALILTGLSFQFVVCTDAPFTYNIDNGKKRTVINQLNMYGSVVPECLIDSRILSIARMVLSKKSGRRSQSTSQIEEYIFNNQNIFEALKRCTKKDKARGISIVPVLYSLYAALLNNAEEESIKRFYEILVSGVGNGTDLENMVVRHRNYLLNVTANTQSGSTYYDDITKRTQKVISLFINNKALKAIYTPIIEIYATA